MEAILDSQADMASFFTSVRKAHCMNVLHTPPSSPESNGSSKRISRPRLHLSKFLRAADKRETRKSRATNGTTSPGSCGERASKSPFRAVTEMKEPFPLMLPDSPALTDESSHDDERQRLRRVSASHLDLKALARVQAPSPSNGNTPLLPSPMFKPDETQPQADSYFAYPKRKDTPPPDLELDNDDADAPYEVHRVISGYCKRERWSLLLDEVRQSKQASQLKDASSPWTQPKESPQPITPPSQIRKRDRTCSTESDWLASNTSHEERYRRFKQRCCGMVQHPARRSAPARADGEDEIMLATVLIGPGKPRLVQIQRPPSSTTRSSHSRASQNGTTTEDDMDSPATPVHGMKAEISTFSPYDTPCQRTYGAMTSMLQMAGSEESEFEMRPAPLSITPRARRRRDSAVDVPEVQVEGEDERMERFEEKVFGATSIFASHPSSAYTPPTHSHRAPTSTLQHRQLASALHLITAAIDAFPTSLLHLDAPLIRQLRNTRIPAHVYVAPLQRVFPSTSPSLLSALASWWCIERYLAGCLRGEDGDGDEEESYQEVYARSSESLQQIPRKARRMLGIRSVDLRVDSRREGRMLKARVEVVRVSVGVIAQRLMEAIKGGWVVELWRGVGVVVELVEGRGSERGASEMDSEGSGGEEWV